ncbi:MAG: hypothetical protein HY330_07140 [Chloroflexi bacterium]|nr:hypothetical protein [Chloroflexota bacterium]
MTILTILVVGGLAALAFLYVAWPLLRRPLVPANAEPPAVATGPAATADELETDLQLGLLARADVPPVVAVASPAVAPAIRASEGGQGEGQQSPATLRAEIEREVAALRERRREQTSGGEPGSPGRP